MSLTRFFSKNSKEKSSEPDAEQDLSQKSTGNCFQVAFSYLWKLWILCLNIMHGIQGTQFFYKNYINRNEPHDS